MKRRDFLKSMGLVGAVVITAPTSYLPAFKSKEETDVDIFFAKHEGSIYILFRNHDRVFEETTHASEDEYADMSELKQRLVDHLIEYYG